MDPKRKRIYIIIIAVCAVVSIGILLMGRFGGKGAAPVQPTAPSTAKTTATSSNSKVTGDIKTGYSAPAVFPANPSFDFSVLDSSAFKQLQPYAAVINDPSLLGREDPFKSY